ncbi:MAG: hypothetical protein XE08_0322 [Parcubacteria bacterium 32_520]|nr:MAG: hypothetical protein XE08_0322 [Parcubacteria bacterium 32_520]
MKIKELKKILEEAPDENAEVFINGLPQDKETDIGFNYNDNNDLDLYIV